MRVDLVVEHCRAVTFAGTGAGLLEDALVAIADGRIAWVGARGDPPRFAADDGGGALCACDARGGWLTRGLVDAHTHLVYAGDRAQEFEMLEGAGCTDISRAGGGILSTVRATRAAGEAELTAQSGRRLAPLAAEGVSTAEIESGSAWTARPSCGCCGWPARPARRTTSPCAPPCSRRTRCRRSSPAAPTTASTPSSTTGCRVPRATASPTRSTRSARALRSAPRSVRACSTRPAPRRACRSTPHADPLSDHDGAALAARHGALSADHLEWTNEAGVAAIAAAGTVAMLQPDAFYLLRETRLPLVRRWTAGR